MLQFLHQAIDGRSFADIDQLTDVPEFLLSLLICGSARFFFFVGINATRFHARLYLLTALPR